MESLGPYKLEAELGRGAMGVVFRGYDPAIGRPVAIKIIQFAKFATTEDCAELKQRFAREATAAGRLSHPNIVTIFHFGEADDLQYLVQELVEGSSLDRMLRGGVPELDQSLAILSSVAGALDYAHANGVVHRDVKPANILIANDGRAKLTDFGIARLPSQTITQTGASMGTPAYMAPEQIQGLRIDGRADQFSLAVVAYQLLAGRRPFVAENDANLLFKMLAEDPPPIHTLNPALPAAMSPILLRALAKAPEARFPSCTAFTSDLALTLLGPLLAPVPPPVVIAAPPPPPPPPPPAPPAPPAPSPITLAAPVLLPPTDPEERSRFWLVAGAIATCALIAVFLSLPSSSPESAPTQPAATAAPKQPDTKPKSAGPIVHKAGGSLEPPKKFTGTGNMAGIQDVFFDPHSALLRDDTAPVLRANAATIRQYFVSFPKDTIRVMGWADDTEGATAELAALSKNRALAVQQALIKLGIPAAKMNAVGLGSPWTCTPRTDACLLRHRIVSISVNL